MVTSNQDLKNLKLLTKKFKNMNYPENLENLDAYLDTNMSNFEGDTDMLYTGESDDFLNFNGAQSFANEVEGARIFVANINAPADMNGAKKIALLKGYEDGDYSIPSAENGTVPVESTNPEKKSRIIISGSPSSFIGFLNYVKNVPANLVGIRIQSDKPEQLQQVLQFIEKSPFSSPESKDFFLGSYINENTYRDNIVTVPTPGIILGPETKMLMTVVPGAKTSVTFFVGAVLSTSSALRKKRIKAISHINAVGLNNVRKYHAVKPHLPFPFLRK